MNDGQGALSNKSSPHARVGVLPHSVSQRLGRRSPHARVGVLATHRYYYWSDGWESGGWFIIVVQTVFYAFYHADIDNRFRMPLEPFLLMYGSALVWRIACRVRGHPCTTDGRLPPTAPIGYTEQETTSCP